MWRIALVLHGSWWAIFLSRDTQCNQIINKQTKHFKITTLQKAKQQRKMKLYGIVVFWESWSTLPVKGVSYRYHHRSRTGRSSVIGPLSCCLCCSLRNTLLPLPCQPSYLKEEVRGSVVKGLLRNWSNDYVWHEQQSLCMYSILKAEIRIDDY